MPLREYAPPSLRRPATPTPRYPSVVAGAFKAAQTAATATTSLFSVRESGLYRFSAAAYCTTGGDAINLTVNAIYTDPVGSATTACVSGFTLLLAGRNTGTPVLIRAIAGSTISYSATISGMRVASIWSYDVSLERLA